MQKKRVLVLGGGLAGLRAALALTLRGYEVTVLERAPMPGGCTSSWIDHRDPEKGMIRKGQMQMNFNFYENLNAFAALIDASSIWGTPEAGRPGWWKKDNSAYSAPLDGYYFFHQDGRRSHLSATPKSTTGRMLKKLPPPLGSLQMLWDFDGMPSVRDKLSAGWFFALALLFGQKALPPISDDWNFYGLCKNLGMTEEAIRAMRRITYSITNLSDADQVGPKFMHLFYLTMLIGSDPLACRMMSDDCNPALIDKATALLRKLGATVRVNCMVRDFVIENGRCHGVHLLDFNGGVEQTCRGCGLRQPFCGLNGMCTACGADSHSNSVGGRPETIEADYVISAMQPHQLAKLYAGREDHPLSRLDYFTALGEVQGASLTVSRVFMDAQVTDGYNLTGLDRDHFSLNGAMDLSHIMPKYAGASVFDTLSDDGRQLALMPTELLKSRLRADLARIFPNMAKARVRKHLLAKIGPDVLYHRAVPRLNERFLPKGPQTPIANLFLAGDWTDELELGKEAATRSGVSAANAVIEADGRKDLEPLLRPEAAPLVGWMQNNFVSRWLRGRFERSHATYLPPRRNEPPKLVG